MILIVNTPSVTPLGDQPSRKTEQPTSVITIIEDILAWANDHEHQAYHRYRWLSLRFLTYHIGISKLMQALASESRQRVQALMEVSASLPIDQSPLRDPAMSPGHDQQVASHFFIFDDEVATQAFSRAMLEEWRSQRFYERLQAYNAIPGLHAWLNDCIAQSQAHFQILQEARCQLPALLLPFLERPHDERSVSPRRRHAGRV